LIFADQSNEDPDSGGLRRLYQLLRRWRLLVLGSILIGVAGGISMFAMTTKLYVATAVVVLDVRKVSVAPLDLVISRLPQDNPAIKTEIDVLGSRSMAEGVIQRVGINNFGMLLARSRDSTEEHYRQALIDAVTSGVQVSNDGRSFTIYISYTASDPVFAARIANAYAEQYFAHQTAVKLDAIRTASEWLGRKVEELRRKLEVSERAVDTPGIRNLNELQRDVAANRILYESFLTRYKATIEQQDLAAPEAQLVSEARPPSRHSTPKFLPYLALGIFVGAACGISAAFLREHFDNSIGSLAKLQALYGLPILGTLPTVRRQRVRRPSWLSYWSARLRRRSGIFAANDEFEPSLQKLQAALRFSRSTRDARIIAITSPAPGDGKTFASISLARAISASGLSALLIGGEPVRLALSGRLRAKTAHSWDRIIQGAEPFEEFVEKDPGSDLHFIAADCSGSSMALFTSSAFEQLLASLRKRYDRIIIDTPPITQSAETAVLGTLADVTVLVLRWRTTTYRLLRDALHQLSLCSLRVGGLVLNHIDTHSEIYFSASQAGADLDDNARSADVVPWRAPTDRPHALAQSAERRRD